MNPFSGIHYEPLTISKQDYTCFICDNFKGTNEAGDMRCKKENGFMNYRDKNTIVKCKKNKWFVENLK